MFAWIISIRYNLKFLKKLINLNTIDDDDDDDWNDNQQKSIVGRCLVQYDYKGARDDELNLKNGDIIEIIEKRTDGWWRGLLNNSIVISNDLF